MNKIILLKEGSVRKGGHNEMPTRPRPKSPPKGQGVVTIPVSQLVKAHKLVDKIERELLTLGYTNKELIEDLKDCITITY